MSPSVPAVKSIARSACHVHFMRRASAMGCSKGYGVLKVHPTGSSTPQEHPIAFALHQACHVAYLRRGSAMGCSCGVLEFLSCIGRETVRRRETRRLLTLPAFDGKQQNTEVHIFAPFGAVRTFVETHFSESPHFRSAPFGRFCLFVFRMGQNSPFDRDTVSGKFPWK